LPKAMAAKGMARETGLEPATSGVTGYLESVNLQRDMELLRTKNSPVGLTGVPTNLEGFPHVKE
jgi:hypothetical protein